MNTRIGFLCTIVTVASTLSACQSYSDTPSRVIEVEGNYAGLADCTYVKIESQGAWRKEDLPSLRTTRLLRGDDKYAVGRVDISAINENKTRVSMQFSPGIKGPNYYPDIIERALRQCEFKG